MAKKKKGVFILNRKDWNRIRKMDHCQMTLWAESIYKSGFRDGNEAAEGLTLDEMKDVILSVKGIGEKRAVAIAEALQVALNDRKDGNENEKI